MAQYYAQQYPQNPNPQSAQNLQFYPSSYSTGPVSGHSTPFQAGYGSPPPNSVPVYPSYGGGAAAGFGAPPVTGRMGEQGGLRTGWLAALGTEGYDGEPPLLEELGVNFEHIKTKVATPKSLPCHMACTMVLRSAPSEPGLIYKHRRSQC
jgi:protein YIPF5/7